MRILIVTETFPPEVNGVALTVAGYRRGLAALGHEVHVLRPRQPGDDARVPERRTYLCGGFRLPRYPSLRVGLPAPGGTAEVVRRVRPDILYIATEGPLGLAALRAARRSGTPAVAGFHTNFHEFSRHYGLGMLAAPAFAYLRRFHNGAAATLVGTEALRGRLRAAGFANVLYSPRGVDTSLFTPARRDGALRAGWGACDDTPVVIHVGRLAAEKNIGLVTDAFAVYRSVRSDARLVLVGDGPQRAALERRMPEAVFCGMQTGAALAAHYASGDILLFPSLTETFGNVTLEGLASGLAVVAYDYAAAREHVTHGRTGMIARYGDREAYLDCVRRLGLDPTLASNLRTAARRAAMQAGLDAAYASLAATLRDRALEATDAPP